MSSERQETGNRKKEKGERRKSNGSTTQLPNYPITQRPTQGTAGEKERSGKPILSLWEREERLEQEADALLRQLPPDPDCPTYTEGQFARHQRGLIGLGAVEERLIVPPSQPTLDELAFLASVTRLSRPERACLRAWMLGWTQRELCARWATHLNVRRQQDVSRLLRSALHKCYDSGGLSFAQFSRHALYRRPAHRRGTWRLLACPYCHEEFVWGLGVGRYCSQGCREAARHKARV